jgi:arylsulfatase
MPTLIELSKATYPAHFNNNTIPPLEGRSIVPQFQGKQVMQHTYMYWEHEDNEAIRKGNWKAVKDGNKKSWELYDLSSDRIETKNIATQHPEILKELITKWEEWANSHHVFPKHKGETK